MLHKYVITCPAQPEQQACSDIIAFNSIMFLFISHGNLTTSAMSPSTFLSAVSVYKYYRQGGACYKYCLSSLAADTHITSYRQQPPPPCMVQCCIHITTFCKFDHIVSYLYIQWCVSLYLNSLMTKSKTTLCLNTSKAVWFAFWRLWWVKGQCSLLYSNYDLQYDFVIQCCHLVLLDIHCLAKTDVDSPTIPSPTTCSHSCRSPKVETSKIHHIYLHLKTIGEILLEISWTQGVKCNIITQKVPKLP